MVLGYLAQYISEKYSVFHYPVGFSDSSYFNIHIRKEIISLLKDVFKFRQNFSKSFFQKPKYKRVKPTITAKEKTKKTFYIDLLKN